MNQLNLPLGPVAGAQEGQFIVSEANARAVHHIEHWGAWPVAAALLTGPRKSGRSLLGRIFAARSGGRVIDDAERQDEETLFHAWNHAQAERRPLLIIADVPPPEWPIALPDLRSRIAATPVERIAPPDDALIIQLIQRGLDARALYSRPDVAAWLAGRIERSYVAIERVVDLLETEARSRDRRRLSVQRAREWLDAAGLLIDEPTMEETEKL
ncbi:MULTISPECIES: DnaA/Hda family protein [unclassified Sphingomonas]|uniref:DnaA/Hda family protein n=1 Tax=unclassified Sphingomonas TaxID=196159 RepID=UPI000836B7E3|nr:MULTISPECIES: DnaA/Hda family protein [unclassified Sphingomonas]